MRNRCNNSKNKKYQGDKISVCSEWDSFEKFLNDMGRRPSKFHALRRLRLDESFNVKNCEWLTSDDLEMLHCSVGFQSRSTVDVTEEQICAELIKLTGSDKTIAEFTVELLPDFIKHNKIEKT